MNPFRILLSLLLPASTKRSVRDHDGGKEEFGLWGEEEAARLLQGKGFRIIGRRVRPNRHDELDIIAKKGSLLVFIEVKTRRDESFGRPACSVDHRKKRALVRGAHAFLRKSRCKDLHVRYDVIEVIGAPGGAASPSPLTIRHIEDAFRPSSVKKSPWLR